MTMGMALHRTGKDFEAKRTFDRALALFDRREHARLTRLTRLLRPDDSARVVALTDAEQANTDSIFWMLADPLTLTAENEHWLEFLSRVTYAELMFTVEEFHQRGADSQRGEVLIRYGAPREIIASGPVFGVYSIWWRYPNGLEFFFELYGPTRMVKERSFAEQRTAYEKTPHSFAGVPITRSMDTIPVALTRFRGSGDSADVYIAADIPIAALTSGVDLRTGTVRVGFTAFTGAATLLARDTASLRVRFDDGRSPHPLRRAWRQRFSTVDMGFRVEALQVESGNSARALGAIPISALSGFGISDLLIADSIHSETTAPLRWNELTIAPNIGTIRHGQNLAVAWETYDLGADSTQSSDFSVEIGLVRADGSRLGRAVARVLSGTLGRGEGRGRDDRVAVSFDRRVPARPVTLDYLTLDLGDLAPGRYRLTITVTDAVRNVSAESVRELVIAR
jgi:GWxTD domain-containing protein